MMAKLDKYERVEIVNKIIKKIASYDRTFFHSESKGRTAYFVLDNRSLWFVDHYTGVPLKMIKNSSHKTSNHKRYFSSGGTMWGLINDFKDFIYGDDDSNHNNGYGGLYCPHWGYKAETMKEIQDYAIELGYLKERC